MTIPEKSLTICVILPVFNDWESLGLLLADLNRVFGGTNFVVDVLVVNDGSTIATVFNPTEFSGGALRHLQLIDLRTNVGNQTAIATALTYLNGKTLPDIVLVMDSDGEDQPVDALPLIDIWQKNRDSVVVAQRTRRSETRAFKLFYTLYKFVFRALTGRTVNFGNFMIIPAALLGGLVSRPELPHHLPATLLRSRFPIVSVPTARGKRLAGRSRMNMPALVLHAVLGVSVFSDIMFARLLIAAGAFCTFSAIAIVVVVASKYFATATPGWTTTVVGILAVLATQMLLLVFCMGLMLITSRALMLSNILQVHNLIKRVQDFVLSKSPSDANL